MKQYLKLLEDILEKGTWKDPARENLPRTKSLFGTRMEFDMKDGFPLLTTKKVYFKGIITELLWFLRGDTNIKYLVDNGCNIWNQDAYRWYLKKIKEWNNNRSDEDFKIGPSNIENFIEDIKKGVIFNDIFGYKLGDLGKVYGYQWRNQNGVDQIKTVIDRLIKEPEGRYAILDAWNPSDFSEMALPPCHLLYQFNCRKLSFNERYFLSNDCNTSKEMNEKGTPRYYLDLQLYQRSCDTFLGVPFNITSGSLLLHIISKITGMEPGKFIWVGGDTHIYENHLEAVEEQLSRTPSKLPTLELSKDINWDYTVKHPVHSINELLNYLNVSDIKISGYEPQSKIKAELKTGL